MESEGFPVFAVLVTAGITGGAMLLSTGLSSFITYQIAKRSHSNVLDLARDERTHQATMWDRQRADDHREHDLRRLRDLREPEISRIETFLDTYEDIVDKFIRMKAGSTPLVPADGDDFRTAMDSLIRIQQKAVISVAALKLGGELGDDANRLGELRSELSSAFRDEPGRSWETIQLEIGQTVGRIRAMLIDARMVGSSNRE